MKEYTKRDSCMTMEEVIERNTGILGEIGYQLKRLFQFKKQQTLAKTFAQKRGLRNGGRSNSNIL